MTETDVLVHVTTENGTVINTTENHPFYVEGKRLRYLLFEAAISVVGKNEEFNDRYQKVLNLLKKTLDYMESEELDRALQIAKANNAIVGETMTIFHMPIYRKLMVN